METAVELRKRIHELIENADENLLKKVNEFISDHTDDLEEWQKVKILKGIEDINSGEFSKNEEVRKKAQACIK